MGRRGPATRSITRNGRFVYFANRDNDFLMAFHADPTTGDLTPIGRTPCGGKCPRNFVLDPTENWMLVANQDSNLISVFRRNPHHRRAGQRGKELSGGYADADCFLEKWAWNSGFGQGIGHPRLEFEEICNSKKFPSTLFCKKIH